MNPRVFLDISCNRGPPERMEIELLANFVPKTAENFRALCVGDKGKGKNTGKPLHYKGCVFDLIYKGFVAQAGDLTKNNGFDEKSIFSPNSPGTVGESIYGGTFPDENLDLTHSGPGILSMSNDGPNKNGSRFLLTFSRQRFLDGCHVIFGKVIKGMEIVQHIDQFGTSTGMPSGLVVITDCGEIPDDITCNVIKLLPFVTPPGPVVNTDGGEDKKSNATEFLSGIPPVRVVITDGGEVKKSNVIESDNRSVGKESIVVREVASEKPSSFSNPHQHSDDLSQLRGDQRSVKKLIAMFSQLQTK